MKRACRACDDLGAEALLESGVELRVAVDEARIEQRGAHRDVGGADLDALVDGARRVPDLEAQIPQHVEHVLGDALAPRRLLVGKQEQQIDVGSGRQQPAPVAPGGDDRHALGVRRIGRPVDVRDGVVVEHADELVLERDKPAAQRRPLPSLSSPPARGFARRRDERLQAQDEGGSRLRGVPVRAESRAQLLAQLARVEVGSRCLNRCVHCA